MIWVPGFWEACIVVPTIPPITSSGLVSRADCKSIRRNIGPGIYTDISCWTVLSWRKKLEVGVLNCIKLPVLLGTIEVPTCCCCGGCCVGTIGTYILSSTSGIEESLIGT